MRYKFLVMLGCGVHLYSNKNKKTPEFKMFGILKNNTDSLKAEKSSDKLKAVTVLELI